MAMFVTKSKFKKFIDSWCTVWKLREVYDAKSCDFQCINRIAIPEPIDDLYDSELSDARFIDDGVAEYICEFYKEHNVCMDTTCKKYRWNKEYVDLANQLQDAKKKCKQAFRDLFRTKQK